MQVPLAGPSAKNRAQFKSKQRTLNFYLEATSEGYILQSFPGAKAFSPGNGPCRGAFVHRNMLYQVSGTNLYSISTAGARTSLGAITGAERCIFDGFGTSLVVVSNGTVYQWNGSALSQISDGDLESPNSCAQLNNQMLYDGTAGRFCSSDAGDATSINSLNYATAESKADDTVRVFSYDQLAYIFGEETIEAWWNSGIGNPPFDRIEGGIIPVGLAALHSVASNDSGFYWLGDDKNVYFGKGSAYQRISTTPIANEIESLSVVSDAQGHCFTFQGMNFYEITFPNESRTFCYNESIGIENGWFELSSDGDTGRYLASAHVFFNGKNYVTDYRNGNIYELDLSKFDEFGDEIIRIRDGINLHSGLAGKPGKYVTLNRFELMMETGVGGTDNANPIVMLSWSDDGGRTWSTEQWGTAGKSADFVWKVEWFGLGSFLNRIMRIRVSDKVFWSIFSAAADFELSL